MASRKLRTACSSVGTFAHHVLCFDINLVLADMAMWAKDNPAPATIILISGDGGFGGLVAALQMRKFHIMAIVSSDHFARGLADQASHLLHWDHDVIMHTKKAKQADDGLWDDFFSPNQLPMFHRASEPVLSSVAVSAPTSSLASKTRSAKAPLIQATPPASPKVTPCHIRYQPQSTDDRAHEGQKGTHIFLKAIFEVCSQERTILLEFQVTKGPSYSVSRNQEETRDSQTTSFEPFSMELTKLRRTGVLRLPRGYIAEQLYKHHATAYAQAGVTKWKQYAVLAEKIELVELGIGGLSCGWISLRDASSGLDW